MSLNSSITIAIADDHKQFRENVVKHITNACPDLNFLILAGNGKELIDKLTLSDILPDIILLDINMPVMNGYQTIQIVKERWTKMKVLAFSAFNDEFPVINMLRLGACGFIVKGGPINELCTALHIVFDKGYYYPDELESQINEMFTGRGTNIPKLTKVEMDFLTLCASEMPYKQIALRMKLSIRTVEYYRNKLFKKLNIKSRTGLAMFAIKAGFVTDVHSG